MLNIQLYMAAAMVLYYGLLEEVVSLLTVKLLYANIQPKNVAQNRKLKIIFKRHRHFNSIFHP